MPQHPHITFEFKSRHLDTAPDPEALKTLCKENFYFILNHYLSEDERYLFEKIGATIEIGEVQDYDTLEDKPSWGWANYPKRRLMFADVFLLGGDGFIFKDKHLVGKQDEESYGRHVIVEELRHYLDRHLAFSESYKNQIEEDIERPEAKTAIALERVYNFVGLINRHKLATHLYQSPSRYVELLPDLIRVRDMLKNIQSPNDIFTRKYPLDEGIDFFKAPPEHVMLFALTTALYGKDMLGTFDEERGKVIDEETFRKIGSDFNKTYGPILDNLFLRHAHFPLSEKKLDDMMKYCFPHTYFLPAEFAKRISEKAAETMMTTKDVEEVKSRLRRLKTGNDLAQMRKNFGITPGSAFAEGNDLQEMLSATLRLLEAAAAPAGENGIDRNALPLLAKKAYPKAMLAGKTITELALENGNKQIAYALSDAIRKDGLIYPGMERDL